MISPLLLVTEIEARAVLGDVTGHDLTVVLEALACQPPCDTFKDLLRLLGQQRADLKSAHGKKLRRCHRLTRLPKGIQWKLIQGQIPVAQGECISRLPSETDQYVLALAIVSSREKLTLAECKKIVGLVLQKPNGNDHPLTIREALERVASVRFEKRPYMMDILSVQEWLEVTREAWTRHLEWESFCHLLITRKASLLSDIEAAETRLSNLGGCFETLKKKIQSDIKDVERQLCAMAKDLRKLSETSGD